MRQKYTFTIINLKDHFSEINLFFLYSKFSKIKQLWLQISSATKAVKGFN